MRQQVVDLSCRRLTAVVILPLRTAPAPLDGSLRLNFTCHSVGPSRKAVPLKSRCESCLRSRPRPVLLCVVSIWPCTRSALRSISRAGGGQRRVQRESITVMPTVHTEHEDRHLLPELRVYAGCELLCLQDITTPKNNNRHEYIHLVRSCTFSLRTRLPLRQRQLVQ